MQQTIHATKAPIHTKVTIPGSKSMTYRALILAALADGVSELSGMRINQDVRVFIRALHQLGIATQLDEKNRTCIIAGGNGKFPKTQATVWCGSSKILTKFLLAACSTTPGVFYFDGASQLRRKPLKNLLRLLHRQGVQLIPSDAQKLPFTLIGSDSLEGGEITLTNEITKQLVSALLLIAPYARSPFNFNVSDLANQPDIMMTCHMMAEFGVLVHRIHQGQFMVPVPQRYQAKDYTIEPDFSAATYFFSAAAITGGEVTIQATKAAHSKQSDVKFLSVLEKMGCKIQETSAGLTVKGPSELQGIEISMRNFSDTFLTLAAIAPFAKSPIRITHLGTIKKNELDRMLAVKIQLVKMGIHVEVGEDWIKIFPGQPTGGIISCHHDPRFAMAFSLIGLKVPGVIIDNAECVNKVFPDFYKLWEKLTEQADINA